MKASPIEEPVAPNLADTEEHWNELHRPHNSSLGNTLRDAGQRLKALPLAEIAGVAVAGAVLGYLFFSRGSSASRKTHQFRRLIEGKVIPIASKKIHQTYDNLRNGHSFEKMGREVAKLRSGW